MRRAVRHQSDVLRVVIGTGVLLVATVLARAGEPGLVEVNLFRLVNQLPGFLAAPLVGMMQVGALGAVPVMALIAVLSNRRRLGRMLAVGGFGAWAGARGLQAVVGQDSPEIVLSRVVLHGSVVPGLAFPATHVAVAAAMATVGGPYLSRPARRLAWLAVGLVAVARIYTGAHFPIDVVGGAALGWAVGAAVHLSFGAPRGRAPAAVVEAALAGTSCALSVGAGVRSDVASIAYRARGGDGAEVLVKVVGRDQPDADWLYRAWRLAAFREPEDTSSIGTPAHRVAHEAHLTLLAQRHGVRVPDLILTTDIGHGEHLLVRSWIEGRTLDELPPAEIDGPLLVEVWRQVARLHGAGIVHGSVRAEHVVIDDTRRPWLVELALGEVSADTGGRERDVAELAASLAARLPVEEVVAAAAAALGVAALAGSVGFLQPLTLSSVTRRCLAAQDGVLSALRVEMARAVGTSAPGLQRPIRVAFRNLVPWLGLGFATYVVLPQVGQARATFQALGSARWGWVVPMAAASACTYLMAAVALMGSTGAPLALGRSWAVQVAASFTNRLAPAGIGGMGTNMRYLQAAGSSRMDAAAAVGLNSVAGFLVHAAGVAVVIPLLGAGGGLHRVPSAPDLPDEWPLLAAVVGILVATGLLRWGRYVGRLGPGLRSAASSLVAVSASPRRAAALLGGSAGVTAGYALAFVAAVQAFGGGVPTAKVIAVYLGGSAVAAVAPTPGGLGALEAALVAGLTGVGAPTGPSVAAVLVYRMVTYWAPVLPGLVLFRRLRHHGVL